MFKLGNHKLTLDPYLMRVTPPLTADEDLVDAVLPDLCRSSISPAGVCHVPATTYATPYSLPTNCYAMLTSERSERQPAIAARYDIEVLIAGTKHVRTYVH